MNTYSMNYREELKMIDADMEMCEKIISGKMEIEGSAETKDFEDRLKLLKRYRSSIINKPQYREGIFDPDFTR